MITPIKLKRSDPFDLPPHMVPAGLKYEWIVGEYARRKFLMLADVIRRISGFDNGRTMPVFDFIALEPGKSK